MQNFMFFQVAKTSNDLYKDIIDFMRVGSNIVADDFSVHIFHEDIAGLVCRVKIKIEYPDDIDVVKQVEQFDFLYKVVVV
ncbi:hypothetical protein D3C87_1981870 [compost metagenome]